MYSQRKIPRVGTVVTIFVDVLFYSVRGPRDTVEVWEILGNELVPW